MNKGQLHIPTFLLGVFLIVVSLACMAGHMMPEEKWLCCWRGDIGMALNTATCFVAVGIALLIISFWKKQSDSIKHELHRMKGDKP